MIAKKSVIGLKLYRLIIILKIDDSSRHYFFLGMLNTDMVLQQSSAICIGST